MSQSASSQQEAQQPQKEQEQQQIHSEEEPQKRVRSKQPISKQEQADIPKVKLDLGEATKAQQLEEQMEEQAQEAKPSRPNRYTLYKQKVDFNWNMQDFDIEKAVEQFNGINLNSGFQDEDEQNDEQANGQSQQNKKNKELEMKQIQVRVSFAENKEGIEPTVKKPLYLVKGHDKNSAGQYQVYRIFKDFVFLRQKLVLRWPGFFIPPIPTKSIGSTSEELIVIRTKVLNNFFTKIAENPSIYYGQECQTFLKRQTQEEKVSNGRWMEKEMAEFKQHSNTALLQKYKNSFGSQIEDLSVILTLQFQEQEQNIAISQIKDLQNTLLEFKVDLSDCKNQVRSLISLKEKYFSAMSRLNQVLLPQYEQIILQWVNYSEGRLVKQELVKQPQQQGKQSVSSNELEHSYLLNTQQYGNALKDVASSTKNYNESLWTIYDIFKFQLKETDSILQAIDSYEYLVREKDYLQRNISNNISQLTSLEEKKTTLKIFFMGGDSQTKRERLNSQSESFEQRLKTVNELLNYVLNVLITAIEKFHSSRLDEYKKLLRRSSQQQLIIVKKLMDFHVFELELFKIKDSQHPKVSQGEAK